MKTINDIYKENKYILGPLRSSAKYIEQSLLEDEELLYAVTCFVSFDKDEKKLKTNMLNIKNKDSGIVAITSQRIIFCQKILLKNLFREIDIKNIISVDSQTSKYATGKIRVQSITDNFIIDCNNTDILNKIQKNIQIAKSNIREDFNNNAEDNSNNYEELKKIKELLDMNIITQEEFDIKKKQLLGL